MVTRTKGAWAAIALMGLFAGTAQADEMPTTSAGQPMPGAPAVQSMPPMSGTPMGVPCDSGNCSPAGCPNGMCSPAGCNGGACGDCCDDCGHCCLSSILGYRPTAGFRRPISAPIYHDAIVY